jgi:hypothetical protein
MTAKKIIASVLESDDLPMELGIELTLLGDPFHEDPKLNLEKYKLLWSHVKGQMPKIWRGVSEEIEHARDMYSKGTLKVPPHPWAGNVSMEYALEQKLKNDFISRSYDTMHHLVSGVGMTSLGDCDTKTFHDMVEIMQDDAHDFYHMPK